METTNIRTIPSNVTIVRDSSDDSTMKIQGYALEFNKASQPIPFIEFITPNALDNVDLSDVLLLYGHEYNSILARTTAQTLTLKVDDTGLFFSADLPDTTLGHDTYNNILAGNLSGMSFGFTIADDTWEYDDLGNTVHTITAIESISEISVTPIPAYTETSVSVTRSLEQFEKESEQNMQENEEPKALEPDVLTPEPEVEPEVQEPAVTTDPEPEPEQADEQPAEPEIETQPTNTRSKGEKNMPQVISEPKEAPEVRAFTEFLQKGEVRDTAGAFSTADGNVVIPTTILDIYKQPKDATQLAHYVNKIAVSTPTGKLPILSRATAQLMSVAEMTENPAIAKPQLTSVNYDLVTYRGQLPITFEMAKDYPGITSLLQQYVQDVIAKTEQYKIGELLTKATPVAASSVDDIKDAFNIGLTNYTDKMFVLSESMYATLDKVKDAEGRYLLQDSITSASGKTLFGTNLVIVADTVLGKPGEAHAFLGSVKSFVIEAVKDNVSVQWQRNEDFSTNLGVALRADYQVADAAAGKFITFTPTPAPSK